MCYWRKLEKIKRKAYPEFHCPAILTIHTLQGGQSAQITWLVRHEKTEQSGRCEGMLGPLGIEDSPVDGQPRASQLRDLLWEDAS